MITNMLRDKYAMITGMLTENQYVSAHACAATLESGEQAYNSK